jgi:hypothetical protein
VSSSDSSILILACVDVGLATALVVALLLPRARAAAFTAILAGLAGFFGAVAIGQISPGRPEPRTPGLATRMSTIEQDIATIRLSLGATREAAARSQEAAGQLQEHLKLVINLNNLKEAGSPPRPTPISTPPPSSAKITIGTPWRTGAHVNLTLQNLGSERAAITAGDLSFCPVVSPSPPPQNCTPAPLNKSDPSCKQTFVCPRDGIILDGGKASERPRWATIPADYVKSPTAFRVFVKLDCTDAQGRNCGTEATSGPVEINAATQVGNDRRDRRAGSAPASDATRTAPLRRRANS